MAILSNKKAAAIAFEHAHTWKVDQWFRFIENMPRSRRVVHTRFETRLFWDVLV